MTKKFRSLSALTDVTSKLLAPVLEAEPSAIHAVNPRKTNAPSTFKVHQRATPPKVNSFASRRRNH